MQWPVNLKQTLLNNAGKISVLLLLATMLCAIGYLLPLRTEVFRPTREVLHQSFRGAGEMAALNQAQLSSKTPLRLQSLLVDTGDKVKRGERLAQFDDQELQADEQAAKAALDGAISSEAAAHINWLRQQHVEQQAKDDDRRAQILSRTGKGAISQSDLENTKTSLQTAQLDLASAQYQWQQAQHARTEAQAQWHAAQSRLADAHMEAPFSGLITDRKCSTGDIISPGTTCIELTDTHSLYISARFDESVLGTIQVGDSCDVFLRSHPHQALHGYVERINRSVDSDTREFTANIGLPALPPGWALGERAVVVLHHASAQPVLTLPENLLTHANGETWVWLLEKGHAVLRKVQIGQHTEQISEITQGITPDSLVLPPAHYRPGRLISPVRSENESRD